MSLSNGDRERYARQLVIPEIGEEGQEKLAAASVLVVGAGGLGSPVLLYLAAAGVGRLGIVDDDVVELSNLQRQLIHSTADLGRPKVDSAFDKLRALNPDVALERHQTRFTAATAEELLADYDVIVTAVDDLPSRFLLNDACVLLRKTLVEGAILRFTGLAMTIRGGETACYRCVFPEAPAPEAVVSAAEAGVFGPVAGIIGCIQASEVIKVVTGAGRPLYDRLLNVDAAAMTCAEIELSRESACPVCGSAPSITSIAEAGRRTGS
ncbi:MAG TPA: HesA/MoeB/ThiF family protein [Thermoleophilia bacterium]|nr:HesA/MoeB/ThiF family protein [Thermoleophilia bacterium]HQG02945.1 HesA/MoeB/ThiF family protein [Thermoleophilia bacterium]HQG54198.1 HesA/MoeB/ThiF family protein [Thermoleophilia bacterium]HQJ97303.1 HesA/MoeB/ThiF family protein [Thermoleophilia bacterium]